MSVIIKDCNGNIILYTKGADSTLLGWKKYIKNYIYEYIAILENEIY